MVAQAPIPLLSRNRVIVTCGGLLQHLPTQQYEVLRLRTFLSCTSEKDKEEKHIDYTDHAFNISLRDTLLVAIGCLLDVFGAEW